MAEDYGKTILEATQIIVDGALSGLEYDKTVICTIINNEKAYRGEYTVSDGSSTFLAYSENTDYSKGTSVYVSIPNGDYSKQKLITGKYLTVESDYYTYTSPWKRFVDITGDLIQSNDSASILANNISDDYNENLKCKEVEIWNRDFTDGSNYTCIGLKADFRTWLSSFGTEFGTYGLRLYITTTDQLTSQSKKIVKVVSATLNNYDMYGNPYSFETFYEQQKVFDISGLGNITNMKLVLFQNQDFQDALGNKIPYLDKKGKLLSDNIFVQNIYLAFGYDISEFDSDKVVLYTLETEKYDATSTQEENRKILRVRWIHIEDDGSINCYDEPSDLNSNIAVHWYKYKLGQGISDNIAGAFWIEKKSWLNTFEQTIDPEITEQEEKYKIVIETPVAEFLASLESLDSDVIEAKRILQEKQDAYNFRLDEYNTRASDANAQALEQATEELEEAEDIYNKAVTEYAALGDYYESNILTLTNETLIANKATVDLVQGLSILCDVDGYKGVYTLYDQTNQIQNAVEAHKMRVLTATYESLLTGDNDLDTAESITWQIPIANTMIYPPEDGKEYSTERGDQYSVSADGRFALITRNGEAETGNIGTSFPHATEQQFRIKDYFTESATNNTIYCYVVKNKVTYSASIELVFGPMGTNGTDYTFVLRMETDRTCVYNENTPMPLKIEATLYDYNNLEVLHANNCAVTYKWYSHDAKPKIAFCNAEGDLLDQNGNIIPEPYGGQALMTQYRPPVDTSDSHLCCYIRRLTAAEMRTQQGLGATATVDTVPYYYILEADITTNVDGGARTLGDVTLNAYLPIPYSGNITKYTQIEGTTKIVYSTQGTNPYYYKDKYKIYTGSTEVTDNSIEWGAICADALTNSSGLPTPQAAYYPKISAVGYVTPPSTFTSGNDKRFSAIAKKGNQICWIQPIMIFQDAYSSAMLNAWDGSLTIDEDTGTIMSTMLGAGYKDGENRYNGVLIGDVRHTADAVANTGVYGYHEGVQSFGLNIDGTAFIGKAGKGQIQFNGNSGAIQSMSYKTNQTGMKIDLDDGYIDIRGNKLISVKTPSGEKTAYQCLQEKQSQNQTEITRSTAKFLNTNIENITGDAIKLAAAANKSIARLTKENQAISAILNLYRNNQSVTYDDLDKAEAVNTILSNNDIAGLTILFNKTGFFPVYETTNSKVKIASFDPYLSIVSANESGDISLIKQNTELLHVGDNKYFLQTNDYPEKYLLKNGAYVYDEQGNKVKVNSGVNIDLGKGKITAYDFQILAKNPWGQYKDSYIEINSSGDPYFKIHYEDTASPITDVKEGNGIDLIKISNNAFLIQSQTWGTTGTSPNLIHHGIQLNLTRGTFKAYDNFTLTATAQAPLFSTLEEGEDGYEDRNEAEKIKTRYYGSSITLSSTGKPFLEIILQDNDAGQRASGGVNDIYTFNSNNIVTTLKNTLLHVSTSEFLLQSQDWGYYRRITNKNTGEVTYPHRGLQFDLAKSKLTAYGFNLQAYKSDDAGKRIAINTDDNNYPLRVEGYKEITDSEGNKSIKNTHTRISWEGTLDTNYLEVTESGRIGPFYFDHTAMWTGTKSLTGAGMYLQPEGNGAGFSLGSGKIKMTKAGQLTIGDNFKVYSSGAVAVNGNGSDAEFYIDSNGNVHIRGNLRVDGTISGTPTWDAQGTMGSSGSLGGSGGGSFGLGGAGGSGHMTAKEADFENITVSKKAEFTDSCQVHITGKVGINIAPSTTKDLYVNGATTIGGETEIMGETHIYGLLYAGNVATAGDNRNPIEVEIDTPWSVQTGKLTFRNGLLVSAENVTMTKPSGHNGYVLNKAGHADGTAGDLCYKDNVEISSASFKIGSSVSRATTNLTKVSGYPTISGDTATYAVKVPGQSYSVSGGSVSYSGSRTIYIYTNSDGNYEGWGYSQSSTYTNHSASVSYSGSKSYSGSSGTTDDRYVVAKITVEAT